MTLDVSKAITLAKDLLQTSNDFRPHDRELAAEFLSRAFAICDDLGIDRAEIGTVLEDPDPVPADDVAPVEHTARTAADMEDEAGDGSRQLRHLLDQQAEVLRDFRNEDTTSKPAAKKRSFRLFGWQGGGLGQLQGA